jgi:hypothetical protein
VGRVEVKGRELSQGESLLITGFDSASRQPPPFEGKAWELSPLGMIRSPCLFYRARVLPALTLECSSQTPLFIMSWWSSRVPALEMIHNPHGSIRSFIRWEDNC